MLITSRAGAHAGTTSDPLGKIYSIFHSHLLRLVACALDVKELEKCYKKLPKQLNRCDAELCDAFLEQLKACAPFLQSVAIVLVKMCASAMHLEHPVREMLGETTFSFIHALGKKYEGHKWRTVNVPQTLLKQLLRSWTDLHQRLQRLGLLLRKEYGESAPRIESLTYLEELLRQWRVQLDRVAATAAQLLREEE